MEIKFNGYCKKIYDDGRYFGEVKNNFLDGFGILEYTSGYIYKGFWKQNRMHGIGQFYKESKLINASGKYYMESKLIYEGEYKNGKLNGIGKLYNDDGFYEGEFANGFFNGCGLYSWKIKIFLKGIGKIMKKMD